jgi:hypothetical protein
VWICAWSGCHFHAARDGNAGRVHFRERQRGRQSTEGSPFGNRAGLFGLGGLRIYIDSNGHAGQTATYTISLTPGGGFNQNVMLPCNGAPAMSTCNMSPNSIPLSGSATVSATVIVIATAPAKGLQPPIAPGGRSGLQTLSQRKTVGWPKREVDDNLVPKSTAGTGAKHLGTVVGTVLRFLTICPPSVDSCRERGHLAVARTLRLRSMGLRQVRGGNQKCSRVRRGALRVLRIRTYSTAPFSLPSGWIQHTVAAAGRIRCHPGGQCSL